MASRSLGVFGVNETSWKSFLNQIVGVPLDSALSSLSPSSVHGTACWFYIGTTTFIRVQLSFSTATSLIQAITRAHPDCSSLLTVFLLSCPSLVHFPPRSQIHLLQMPSRSCHFLCLNYPVLSHYAQNKIQTTLQVCTAVQLGPCSPLPLHFETCSHWLNMLLLPWPFSVSGGRQAGSSIRVFVAAADTAAGDLPDSLSSGRARLCHLLQGGLPGRLTTRTILKETENMGM